MALRLLRFGVALLVVTLVHFVGARLDQRFALVFDLFLVLLVTQALPGPPAYALAIGILVGVVEDTFNGRLFGLYACADTIVAYTCALVGQRIVVQRASGILAAYFSAALAQQVVLIVLVLAVLPDVGRVDGLWVVLKAGTVAVLGTAAHLATTSWRRRLAGWRRGRNARLQFGR
jgi:rod shape-determining protein MreD